MNQLHAAAPRHRLALRRRTRSRVVDVWVYNALLIALALSMYLLGVDQLPQQWSAVHVPMLLLAAVFCAESASRVHIHFKRSAQSYSLSEIPLIIGLFCMAPNELLLARLIGSAIGLGLVRKQPPIKLVFNLASFAIETEAGLAIFHRLPSTVISNPVSWFWVLLTAVAVSGIGFLTSAIVITLAEEKVQSRDWLLPAAITLGGAVANASLGLEVVAAVSRNVDEVLLLMLPLWTLAAAYALYTRELQKRQQLQYLYQSSDLLQRGTAESTAIAQLLQQLCQVFRAEMASITLLPSQTAPEVMQTVAVRGGVVEEREFAADARSTEQLAPLMHLEGRGFIAGGRGDSEYAAWLAAHDLRNAICTALHGDGALLGALVVGNRLSDVSLFDSDDLTLLETFAAQASIAVQATRLDNRLKHQAFHDPLTGLANRALFTDRLEHALTRRSEGDALAVLFVDLDDFKMVNDSLGHAAGDDLLRQVAARLLTVLRPSDTAARLGGDEFAVLLEDGHTASDVITVSERLIALFRPHFTVADREVAVHASIGVATAPPQTVSAGELLRRADAAMYRAKLRGKNAFEIFEPGMQEAAARRLEVRTDLERALERDELRLHYQPLVDMETHMPVGVEALLRWQHPRWGLVPPKDFVGIAEESGLIRDIGLHALEVACRQCQRWQTDFPDHSAFSVSVNVSPRQLRQDDFSETVWQILTRSGLHPSRLVLEITESFMVEDPGRAVERLTALKALGVRISIDDFGTGYSSLAVLQDLPIDILKIDKAFIDHVADDPRRAAFAQAIIRMGKTLGLTLIAEGVERAEQADRLRALGCRIAQGFYFARPAEADVIERMLAAPGAEWQGGASDAPLRVLSFSKERRPA